MNFRSITRVARVDTIDYQNKMVSFQVKNYKKGGAKQTQTLSTAEFIRRFGLHILPKGFTRIRHYGILSSGWKKVKLPNLQLMLVSREITPYVNTPKPELLHCKCLGLFFIVGMIALALCMTLFPLLTK